MEPLRREVLPARQPAGLLGPLFVLGSTLALAMAMAAMALAPRPHHRPRVYHRPVYVPAPRIVVEPPQTPDPACRSAVYRHGGGAVDGTYESCAPPRGDRRERIERRIEEIRRQQRGGGLHARGHVAPDHDHPHGPRGPR